jgi:hypothetical protein
VKGIRRFLTLSGREQFMFVAAVGLLPIARASLAAAGYTATCSMFHRLSRFAWPAADDRGDEQIAAMTMRMVRAAAANGACSARCLPRSIVAWTLLRCQGLDPALRLGARRNADVFEAHAWVEIGTRTLDVSNGNDVPSFVPFGFTTK